MLRRRPPLRHLLISTIVVVTAVACDRLPAPTSPPRNVVLVLIDTLRADHLGAYGYERPTSPFIDTLAADGVLFENAVSAAPATFPSVNTILTSVSPNVFNRYNASDFGIPEQMTTLAEAFQSAGFRTAAVSASPIVRRLSLGKKRQSRFNQGFERFDERCIPRNLERSPYTAPCVTWHALGLMRNFAADRFFLYIHYLDPHGPYQPPDEMDRFSEPYSGKDFISMGRPKPVREWVYGAGPDVGITERDTDHLRDLYDGEIRAIDANLQRLLRGFADRGLRDDTLFVILSDHGESFMEHGHFSHGKNMYQQILHVPLIFYWPRGIAAGQRRSDVACAVDVMPTILALAKLPIPKAARGIPLLGSEQSPDASPRACYSEGMAGWGSPRGTLFSLRLRDSKILYYRPEDRYEVYDLGTDPAESTNLADDTASAAGKRVESLQHALHSRPELRRLRAEGKVPAPPHLEPRARRALQALGYID
jgi:arylsulfatase A-like enzyme